MRVVQLIDSLEVGGSETVAVNLANALVSYIEFSGLVVTRKEGDLKQKIIAQVDYNFLERQKVIDLKVLLRFKKYLKSNNVEVIHAHGSSYLFAFLTKLLYPRIKVVWHDHYGARVKDQKSFLLLRICSAVFAATIAVNSELEQWGKNKLLNKKQYRLYNFPVFSEESKATMLKGEEGKRIVMLANLKLPKNHMMLLKSFLKSEINKQGWSLHFIGRNFNDDYSMELSCFVKCHALEKSVFIYGKCSDISNILSQATIGALISNSEAFPVSLVEYGYHNLSVIATDVGENSYVIKDGVNGYIVSVEDIDTLADKLNKMIADVSLRDKFAVKFNRKVRKEFSIENSIKSLVKIYNEL